MAAPLPALVGCNQKDAENNSVGILKSVSESQIRKIIALAMGLHLRLPYRLPESAILD
jgi:hypothetical protein